MMGDGTYINVLVEQAAYRETHGAKFDGLSHVRLSK